MSEILQNPQNQPVHDAPVVGDGKSQTANSKENRKSAPWLKPYHFQPGQSGNPEGRPKKKPVTDILESIFADTEFVKQHLRDVISGKSAIAKVMLVEKAAERLEGKVVQPVDLSGNVALTVSERISRARDRALVSNSPTNNSSDFNTESQESRENTFVEDGQES